MFSKEFWEIQLLVTHSRVLLGSALIAGEGRAICSESQVLPVQNSCDFKCSVPTVKPRGFEFWFWKYNFMAGRQLAFCRDKDFIPVSGSPGEIRGSTIPFQKLLWDFMQGKWDLPFPFIIFSSIVTAFFSWRTGTLVRLCCCNGSIQTLT